VYFSKYANRRGDKSAKSVEKGLLSLLSPPHIRSSESHAPGRGCRAKGNLTTDRPWLETLKSLEERTSKEEEGRAHRVLSSTGEIPGPPVQRGAKSAKTVIDVYCLYVPSY
jgi:hypothetical protein